MGQFCSDLCPQCQRAMRLCIKQDRPTVDRPKLIEALPGKTPEGLEDIIQLIIQIVLALLENKDKPEPEPPMPPPTE